MVSQSLGEQSRLFLWRHSHHVSVLTATDHAATPRHSSRSIAPRALSVRFSTCSRLGTQPSCLRTQALHHGVTLRRVQSLETLRPPLLDTQPATAPPHPLAPRLILSHYLSLPSALTLRSMRPPLSLP